MSRKGHTENCGFGGRDTCFLVSLSSRTRTMTLEHFLNGRNRTHFENRENAGIEGNSVKMTFSTFKTPKLGHFSRYLPGMLYTYRPNRVFENLKIFPLF